MRRVTHDHKATAPSAGIAPAEEQCLSIFPTVRCAQSHLRILVRTCDNSSLKADRLTCLSIHILYHFFRLFALCGVALSNIALWSVALFVLHGFYGAVKETARAPRFASRGAETPRWGVSRARLGESLRVHKKSHCDVLLQCDFCFNVI